MAETVVSTVTVQNGGRTYDIQLEHPRDASDEQISAFAEQQVRSQFPETKYPTPQVQRPKPESFVQGVAEGAALPFNNIARLIETGADAVGISTPIANASRALGMAGTVAEAEAAQNAAFQASPYQGSGFGRFVGEVGGTLPTMALPGGPLVQGAAGGAMLTKSRDPIGVGIDAGIGAVSTLAGMGVMKGAAFAANPTMPAELRTLVDAGVRVTPGQLARSSGGRIGNFVARSEDRAVSTPFVGDTIVAGRNASFEDFGRAAVNRSLEPIGQTLPEGLTGRRAIKYAGDKLSAEYDRISQNIGTFAADQQFADDLAAIGQIKISMADSEVNRLNRILGDAERFFGNGGTTLNGASLKEIETRLGREARRFARSQNPDHQQTGEALETALDAIRSLAVRANPNVAGELEAANRGYASLVQAEKASMNSKARITPAGYSDAVRQSSNTVRNRGYARGDALNQDLSDAASNVLPSEITDTGTAGRWQQSNLLANAIGAAQIPAYAAARGVTPALTRNSYLSPQLRNLLEYAARGAPVAAPALIEQLRQ